MFLIRGSIPRMNRIQLRASPCLTPFFILYLPEHVPLTIISTDWFLYSRSKVGMKSVRPIFFKISFMYQCWMESKAFSASNETIIASSPISFDLSIAYRTVCRLSTICRSLM